MLTLKMMGGAASQGMQASARNWNKDSPSDLQTGLQSSLYLVLAQCRLNLTLKSRQQNNTFLLFYATAFVVTCYRNNKN